MPIDQIIMIVGFLGTMVTVSLYLGSLRSVFATKDDIAKLSNELQSTKLDLIERISHKEDSKSVSTKLNKITDNIVVLKTRGMK